MILRVFRARIHPGMEARFEEFLRTEAIPLTKRQDGILGFWVGAPHPPETSEYVFVSFWRDLEALVALRGPDISDPGILDEERDVIENAFVHHYESSPLEGFESLVTPELTNPSPRKKGRP